MSSAEENVETFMTFNLKCYILMGKKVESMFGQSQTVYVGQSLILFQSLSVHL